MSSSDFAYPWIAMKFHTGKLKSTVLAVSFYFRKAFHWPFCRDMVAFSPLLPSGVLPWISQNSPFHKAKDFSCFCICTYMCVHMCEYTQICLSICVWDLTAVNSWCKLLPSNWNSDMLSLFPHFIYHFTHWKMDVCDKKTKSRFKVFCIVIGYIIQASGMIFLQSPKHVRGSYLIPIFRR